MNDVANTNLSLTVGPVAESIFSLTVILDQVNDVYSEWRQRARDRLDSRITLVKEITKNSNNISEDLMRLVDRPPTSSQGDHELSKVMEVCRTTVVPYWSNILEHLGTEREAHGRILASRGMNGLLATLHPKIRWNPPVLEIHGGHGRDVHLNGRGIQLTPALFLAHRPGVVMGLDDEHRQAALAFPTPPSPQSRARLWDIADHGKRALGALIGPKRADALAGLRENPCTTGELAARLGISSSGASQHASVLRRAGLITTRRDRNSSLHVVTTLGTSLLDGQVASHAFRVRLPSLA
jgi:DNA-binding transcriptional ArsR family regulator